MVNQQWDQFTGRAVGELDAQARFHRSDIGLWLISHGYKAGGANPPGAVLAELRGREPFKPIPPVDLKPEFINAFELGSKNTLLDGALTFNADVFYYNYKNYQILEVVDRTSIN